MSSVQPQLCCEIPDEKMSWEYVAGFFDGEGSVVRYKCENERTKYGLSIAQVNQEVLQKIVEFTGVGSIYTYPRNNPNHSALSTVYIGHHEEQAKFTRNVLPYSIVKAKKLRRCLAFIEGREWYANAKLRNVDKNQLALEHEQGVSFRRLGEKYGLAPSAIFHYLKKPSKMITAYPKVSLVSDDVSHKKDISWAYVAGFFDAEGHITKDRTRATYVAGMCQTSIEVLERIVSFMGFGRICKHVYENPNYRPIYKLQIVAHHDLEEFAKHVLPHSIVKAKLLGECLEFVQNRKWFAWAKLRGVSNDQLASEYYGGLRVEDLASKYSVSMHTILYHLCRVGVVMRPKGRISSIDKAQLLSLHHQGLRTKALSQRLGLAPSTIRRHLRLLDVAPYHNQWT